MTYDFAPVVEDGVTRHTLKFCKAIGTSHNSLMMSALYRKPPSRDTFVRKIEQRFE
jgi:hypothetical protein